MTDWTQYSDENIAQSLNGKTRMALQFAADSNPDQEAEAAKLAKRYNLPADMVGFYADEYKKQAKIEDSEAVLNQSPRLKSWLAADDTRAKIAHDDLPNMSAIEQSVSMIGRAGRSIASGVPTASAGFYGAAAAPFELVGIDSIGGWLRDQQKASQRAAASWQGADPSAGFVEKSVMSGFQSAGQNLAMLPVGFANSARLTGEQAMLGLMGLVTGGQSYGKARDQGLAPAQAIVYGVQDAAAEVITEKYLGMAGFIKNVKAGASVGKLFGYEVLKEVPGEIGATLWQNFNEWGNLNPDKPIADWIAEQPEAIAQTIIATLVGGTTQIGAVKGVEKIGQRFADRAQAAQQAEATAEQFAQFNELATASKVLGRDAGTFEHFVAQAAEEGPTQDVYISATALMQSGLAEQLAQASPAVAEQLQTALETGGDVRISVAEYTTRIAATDAAPALLDHLKFDPNGFTKAEAQVYLQNHATDLQAEVERTLSDQQNHDAFKASQTAVKDLVLGELNALGRFTPAKNELDATLIAARTAVRAAQLGITPEAMFQKQLLKLQAQGLQDSSGNATLQQAEPDPTGAIDESTGLPLNSDGTVTVYHHTNAANAAEIRRTGKLQSAAEPDLYFTTTAETGTGYGDTAIPFRVKPERLLLDDGFPDGRQDFRVETKRTDKARRVRFLPDGDAVLLQSAKAQVAQQIGTDFLAMVKELGKGAFQYPDLILDKDLDKVLASTGEPGFAVRPLDKGETKRGAADESFEITAPDGAKGYVYRFGKDVQIDVSELEAGTGRGSAIYQSVANWTKASGYVFEGDSAGITLPGILRRTENMISTIARHRDSYHVRPHPDQVRPENNEQAKALGLTGIKWATGEHEQNLGELLLASYNAIKALAPEIENVSASEFGDFTDASSLDFTGADSELIGDAEFQKIVDQIAARFESFRKDGQEGRISPYGVSTVKRAAIVGTLYRRATDAAGAGVRPDSAALTRLLYQSRKKTDDRTLDLFADQGTADRAPSEEPAVSRELQPAEALPRGTFANRTELVQEGTRELGAASVNSPIEAAQALAYLGRGAVERFDALITDQDGKPLAIVGAFKGAIAQASVFPATLVGEAFRVPGAANIWFAHNHPSGSAVFSQADLNMTRVLTDAFRGSAITPRGLFAIAGGADGARQWVYSDDGNSLTEGDEQGATTEPAKTTSVKVMERVYVKSGALGEDIRSPSDAKRAAKALSGGESGLLLLSTQNAPIAFVPVDPAVAGQLRGTGGMDALYKAFSVANPGAAIVVNQGGAYSSDAARNLIGISNSLDIRVLDQMDVASDGQVTSRAEQGDSFAAETFLQNQQAPRGAFDPVSNTIALLKNADLSTFLHEAGHFFFENDIALAAELAGEARLFGVESLKPGERQILADVSALLTWHGIQGDLDAQLAQWQTLPFEEKRSYHERTAESFEAYLLEGKAPSIELQRLFQTFRAWLLNVYRSLKYFVASHPEAGQLNDEVRGVFDRMLATSEQIQLAEQGRSMMPLFNSAKEAGMTPEEFAAYQALGVESTNEAIQDLQARGLRDLQWLKNAHGKEVKKLQRAAAARRADMQIEVRREVMSQPIYRVWQFLTGKLGAENKVEPIERPKSDPAVLDPEIDSLFVAIGKLGGLDKSQVIGTWGIDPADKPQSGVFGKPLWRVQPGEGLSIDGMAEALGQYGYLPVDQHGKVNLQEFETLFREELSGTPQYSHQADYAALMERDRRAGDQIANPLALTAGRLDRGALAELGVPAEIADHVVNLKMTAKDGLHPDLVAELFEFSSGDELVRTLAATEAPKVAIEAMTDQRMLERYGDLSSQAAIERAADKAIHNDARARMVATEANALAQATGQRKVLASAAREYAAAMIARLKVRDLRPNQYASAEVRAGKAAEKASKAGDLATAAAEKRNQLINTYATRAAYDAQDEIERGVRYLGKFDNEGSRKNLDVEYLDQIDRLRERFDLRKGQSLRAIDKREALAKWIESQENAGLEPNIPEWLQAEANRTHYKNLTLEEFRGLVDSVQQIEHLGRLKKKLLTAKDQRELDAIVAEITASIEVSSGGREINNEARDTLGSTLSQFGRWALATHRKAASVVREMDGFKDGGPLWEYFIRAMNSAGDREATMRADATAKLYALARPILAGDKMGGKGVFSPSLGRSLNRGERLAVALNWGNEGNRQRLMGGQGWQATQLHPVLGSLTAEDWAFVQGVWDFFESYRPEIAAKERRVYGKEPDWIAPAPFSVRTADGQDVTLRGGYYPIKYDPKQSGRAGEFAESEDAKAMMRAAYTASTTRRSFTKGRAEEVSGRPLLLTFDGIWQGANEVIHDLTWHEWLIDANRLLKRLDAPIRTHYGAEVVDVLRKAVKDTARGDQPAANQIEKSLSHLRAGATITGLGWNLTTSLLQPLGITQSMVRIGPAWVARGLRAFYGTPSHMIEKAQEVQDKSEFMANRARTMQREINELQNQLSGGKSDLRAKLDGSFFILIQKLQATVDYPTWLGAYEKATAEGNAEDRAIALADQAVIDAQGGGQIKDLAEVQRGGPWLKLFTNFYSFFNVAMNLATERTKATDFKKPKDVASLAGDYLLILILPAVLGSLLKAALKGGDDDEEKLMKRVAEEQIGFLLGLFVGVRELTGFAQAVAGVGNPGLGYGGPAGLRFFQEMQKLGQQISQGEADMALFKAANSTGGILFHYPAGQINRAVEGSAALLEGRTSNPLAPLVGPPPKN